MTWQPSQDKWTRHLFGPAPRLQDAELSPKGGRRSSQGTGQALQQLPQGVL